MPVEGEVPVARLFKNIAAAALSGAGYEIEHFYFKERQRRREEDPRLSVLMMLAGVEKGGGELGAFFKEYNFAPTIIDCLPAHEEDE